MTRSVSNATSPLSVCEICSRPSLTNGERKSISESVNLLQILISNLPGLSGLAVALVPAAEVRLQDATLGILYGLGFQDGLSSAGTNT